MHAYSVTSLSGQVLMDLAVRYNTAQRTGSRSLSAPCPGHSDPARWRRHGRGQEDRGFPTLTVLHAITDLTNTPVRRTLVDHSPLEAKTALDQGRPTTPAELYCRHEATQRYN